MGWTDETEIEKKSNNEERERENSNMDEIDLESLAPSAMDVSEAAEKEHTWKVLVWGNEGTGKSHFCYTMPEPICFIDTENKADDIAHKFEDKVVQIWQPSDFEEAKQCRDEALSFLSEYESQIGDKGTIVVDSMDVLWEWAQHKYIDKHYKNASPSEVNLTLQDWGPIKKIHNSEFRQPIESCNFHVAWTATRKDDVKSAMEEELEETPDKPGGETNNVYKVNSIIRLKDDAEGIPVGNLQKSGIVRFKYLGLRRPTFEKHKRIVEHVEEIEKDGANSVQDVESAYELSTQHGEEYGLYGFTEVNTMRNHT